MIPTYIWEHEFVLFSPYVIEVVPVTLPETSCRSPDSMDVPRLV